MKGAFCHRDQVHLKKISNDEVQSVEPLVRRKYHFNQSKPIALATTVFKFENLQTNLNEANSHCEKQQGRQFTPSCIQVFYTTIEMLPQKILP